MSLYPVCVVSAAHDVQHGRPVHPDESTRRAAGPVHSGRSHSARLLPSTRAW